MVAVWGSSGRCVTRDNWIYREPKAHHRHGRILALRSLVLGLGGPDRSVS